jgi:DNA invertase Pin-like site-specific DNA recombinase
LDKLNNEKMTKKTPVFAYVRVSSNGQTNGDGFPRQIEAIQKYATQNDLEIVKVYREGHTGTETNRPILTDLLLSLEKNHHGVRTVVIERLDRLARDLMTQEFILDEFTRLGTEIISTTEGNISAINDPTRKLIRQIFGGLAEFDKTMLVSKLRSARQRKKLETGQKVEGRKGYGDSPEGRAILRKISALRRKPKTGKPKTYKQIADQLNEEGITTLEGAKWSLLRVQQLYNRKSTKP